jgi:hypothetical protein
LPTDVVEGGGEEEKSVDDDDALLRPWRVAVVVGREKRRRISWKAGVRALLEKKDAYREPGRSEDGAFDGQLLLPALPSIEGAPFFVALSRTKRSSTALGRQEEGEGGGMVEGKRWLNTSRSEVNAGRLPKGG